MIEVVNYGPFQRHIPGMHNTEGTMGSIQGARLSSPGQVPLQPNLSQEIHTSVIKKTFETMDNERTSRTQLPMERVGGFQHQQHEAMDDGEDFSDHDSHYSEDFEDYFEEEPVPEEAPNVTKQLLGFADMINTDIKKFFGRKKGDEDACDIYEDKWITMKSGRELYYADLIKIAHGGDDKEKGRNKKSKASSNSPVLLDISNPEKDSLDNRSQFSGKLDKKLGMGPLNELFEYGLRHILAEQRVKQRDSKRVKMDPKRFDAVLPMQNRKLPTSFWHEPGTAVVQGESRDPKGSSGTSVQHANNPPDFSDLLESWRLDRSEFNREVSSTDVSMSPESVVEHV